jgi:hypothetical protein
MIFETHKINVIHKMVQPGFVTTLEHFFSILLHPRDKVSQFDLFTITQNLPN